MFRIIDHQNWCPIKVQPGHCMLACCGGVDIMTLKQHVRGCLYGCLLICIHRVEHVILLHVGICRTLVQLWVLTGDGERIMTWVGQPFMSTSNQGQHHRRHNSAKELQMPILPIIFLNIFWWTLRSSQSPQINFCSQHFHSFTIHSGWPQPCQHGPSKVSSSMRWLSSPHLTLGGVDLWLGNPGPCFGCELWMDNAKTWWKHMETSTALKSFLETAKILGAKKTCSYLSCQ